MRKLIGKDCIYKFFWKSDSSGLGGVGILLGEQWIDKVLSVVRVNHQIMTLKLLVRKRMLAIFCVYALHYGRMQYGRKSFYSVLLNNISTIQPDALIVCGDPHSHIGKDSDGFKGIHSGYGYGIRNAKDTKIRDMCAATNLEVANSFFKKDINKLNTLSSDDTKTQIEYILTRHANLKYTKNVWLRIRPLPQIDY